MYTVNLTLPLARGRRRVSLQRGLCQNGVTTWSGTGAVRAKVQRIVVHFIEGCRVMQFELSQRVHALVKSALRIDRET